MIDAKKVNLTLILLLIILIFSPPYFLVFLSGLAAIICVFFFFLRLSAITRYRSHNSSSQSWYQPFVTIIIACANEPYRLMNKTLNALAKQNYSRYEVLVLDNNNTNAANWQQIEKICRSLGEKFRFIHRDYVSGYKAGALNLAYKYLNQKTEIIAVVDADYIVEPNFLKETTWHFADPNVAIVQAPQDYFDRGKIPGLYANYRTFFSAYMNQAQLLDTVTFTGTMGLLRKSLFDRDLKWNEWCITEDTEAGVYIHALGYAGAYVDRSFGRGMMPLSYESLIKQRSRWSYGNMQIILKNFWPMVKSKSFTLARKLGFLTQLIAWIRLDLILLIVLAASIGQAYIYPDAGWSLISYKIALSVLVYSALLELVFFVLSLGERFSLKERALAFLVQSGLSFTMSYSWIYMIFGGRLGFQVTTKSKEEVERPRFNQEIILPILAMIIIFLSILAGLPNYLIMPLLGLLLIEVGGIYYLQSHLSEAI